MKVTTNRRRTKLFNWMRSGMLLLAFACMMNEAGKAQSAAAKTDGAAVNDIDAPPVSLSPTATAGQRTDRAWKILTDAAGDVKRMQTQTRIQALAALSLLRCPRSAKMIVDVMTDPDVDIRTAAALAAGQTGDPNLTTNLRICWTTRSRRSRSPRRWRCGRWATSPARTFCWRWWMQSAARDRPRCTGRSTRSTRQPA